MADCGCHANPHELWCSQAPAGLDIGSLREAIVQAVELDGVHESKVVAIEGPDGRYMAVASAQVRFVRGQFALVLTPVES